MQTTISLIQGTSGDGLNTVQGGMSETTAIESYCLSWQESLAPLTQLIEVGIGG